MDEKRARLEDKTNELNKNLDEIDKKINALTAQINVPPPQPQTGFDHVVVLDGLPVVDESKFRKLEVVLGKKLKEHCQEVPNKIHLQVDDETGKSKSYAFIEFEDAERAAAVAERMNEHHFDKAHILKANVYSKMEDLLNVSEEFVEPDPRDFKLKEDLRSWLLDPRPLDQYATHHGEHKCEIFWNEPTRKPDPIYSRKQWTDYFVAWSPLGTYLVTVHPQGVQLWGGKSWTCVTRLHHHHVRHIHFSPNENFVVTFSQKFQENDNPKDPQCIIVWDVRAGKSRRGFLSQPGLAWPEFRWSHDEKYFARMTPDQISIYESSTMGLLDKKSLKCPGVRDFQWSPTDNIISCWFPESGDSPARVVLYSIPSRKELVSKSLFGVSDCHMHWQGSGDYLCVKVNRAKSKKTTFANFELFRMRSKNIPVEVLEMKDTILAFAWEPKGHRFSVIHTESTNQRPDVTFYEMKKGGGVNKLKTLEKRQASHLFWGPNGGYILLAGLIRPAEGGHLEFYNVNELETMKSEDHFGCSHVCWDPTGRFITTYVSCWNQQSMENGYHIWTFQGKLIHKVLKERFYQFIWRPRPPSLLSKEKEEHIQKNIKEYSARIAKEEVEEKLRVLKELEDKRNKEIEEFQSWQDSLASEYEQTRAQRRELWGGDASDEDEWEEYEEEVEVVISKQVVKLEDA